MKVLMTGSGGVIGRILTKNLEHDITGYDLPDNDILHMPQLLHALPGHDALIHLAWGKKHDDWLAENFDPNNLQGAFNIMEAAQQTGLPRVIIASSVHADDFVNHGKQEPLDPYSLPVPDSPYGAAKCMIEALGRYYATAKNIEVICIRLGGINGDDRPPDSPQSERDVWLSQRDCTNLIEACLRAPSVPGKYAIINGVSDNKERIHDVSNPFGWHPQDSTN